MSRLSSSLSGLLAITLASSIWGLSALFYKYLVTVPVIEVMAHRSLWSLLFFVAVLTLQGRARLLWQALRPGRGLWAILAAALLISANWFGFVYSVQSGQALEASLGYYTFPLVAVLLGVVVFGDRLSALQGLAIALATAGVLVLILGLGVTPWIALFIATTFGLYGGIKKLSPLGPLVSTAAEVAVLLPLALALLVAVHAGGVDSLRSAAQNSAVFGHDLRLSLLLILSGPMTGLPLLLFSIASKRVSMVSLGLVQYLNPSLQFFVAVAVFGETFTGWHMVAFALIWSALALYSYDAIRRARARQPRAGAAPRPAGG